LERCPQSNAESSKNRPSFLVTTRSNVAQL
jgi:hypothetical protein